jgi:hypothetical protein
MSKIIEVDGDSFLSSDILRVVALGGDMVCQGLIYFRQDSSIRFNDDKGHSVYKRIVKEWKEAEED